MFYCWSPCQLITKRQNVAIFGEIFSLIRGFLEYSQNIAEFLRSFNKHNFVNVAFEFRKSR